MLTFSGALKLCLICDAEPVRAAVRASCLPPHKVEVFGMEAFLNADHTLSAYGESVVQMAKEADAVLIGWSLEHAPLINTICFAVRSRKTFVPLIALCRGGSQGEMIAALAAGVDDAASLPLYIPLFQARVVAHRHLVDAVQRETANRIKKQIEKKIGGDGFSAEPGQVPEGVERVVGIVDVEIEKMAKAKMEKMWGKVADEVDTELILLPADHDVTEVGKLQLDRTAYRVYLADDEVDLTPKEFELLSFLMKHVGTLCTRDQILEHVWGIDFDTGTNMVDVYMHFLRKKLAAYGFGHMLQTIRGRGYRLVVSEDPALS